MIALAWISIGIAVGCASWIAWDEARHPQPMAVMNVVWPVTALYFNVFAVWAYLQLGRPRAQETNLPSKGREMSSPDNEPSAAPPTLAQVAVGASHCGAGCMIADMVCAFAVAAAGLTVLGSVLWAEFAVDFLAAWVLGVLFQYFAIKPMGDLTPRQALVAAVKADTLSIVAFQVGMYAWMAFAFFKLFPNPHLTPFQAPYWLMMQVAMICGFVTTLPMNYLLIQLGLKEAM